MGGTNTVITYPGRATPFLVGIPSRRAGGTGGREYHCAARIQAIRRMAALGQFQGTPDMLSEFTPIQDVAEGEKPTAPYTFEERLIITRPGNVTPFRGWVDTSFDIKTFRLDKRIILGEYSYGATTPEEHEVAAAVAEKEGILFGIGEGGWYKKIRKCKRIMVQVASGVFGITVEEMGAAAVLSIKMSQIAKAGVGGHVVGYKLDVDMLDTRGMPGGIDIISDANRVFSIEEVRQIVESVRRASGGRPVLVKCAATHDIRAIVTGAIEATADGVIIDGRGGGTGAGPLILKNSLGIPIELAVSIAHDEAIQKGVRERFRIIAAGRVDLPKKAFKLHLLGADAVMIATSALIATGCVLVHQCHVRCPALVATTLGKGNDIKRLSVPWGIHVLDGYIRTFNEEVAGYAGHYGFSSIGDSVGQRHFVAGIGFDPEILKLMGIRRARGFEAVEEEIAALWEREHETPFHGWQVRHNRELAESGTAIIGSMGRTTDLDPPRSYLDDVLVEGRHVVGPSADKYRDGIDTVVTLKGNVHVWTPFLLPQPKTNEQTVEMLKTAVSRRTAARVSQATLGQLLSNQPTKAEAEKRIPSILFGIEDVDTATSHTYYRTLRECAGIILPENLANEDNIKRIREISDRPIYVEIKATGTIRKRALRLASLGVDGIIIDGKVGIKRFRLGTKQDIPLEITVPLVDEALSMRSLRGRVLRKRVSIIASGDIRTPDDAFKLMALGANAIESKTMVSPELLPKVGTLVDGYNDEFTVLMGAGGITMTSALIGNRDMLRASEMPSRIRKLMGIRLMGAKE